MSAKPRISNNGDLTETYLKLWELDNPFDVGCCWATTLLGGSIILLMHLVTCGN